MIWVLIVILHGTDVQEDVFFNSLDTCLEYAQKIRSQNYDPSLAGIAKFGLYYCVPKSVPKKSKKNDGTNYSDVENLTKTVNFNEGGSDVEGIQFIYHMREHLVDIGIATVYGLVVYAIFWITKTQ